MISSFTGRWRFLSNFYLVDIPWLGTTFGSVEHAYQASKANNPHQREAIRLARTPGEAKRLGRSLILPPGWDNGKLSIMEALLRIKFADPQLAQQLVSTGKLVLVEANSWGDRYWGQSPLGNGENHLGQLLSKIRKELQHAPSYPDPARVP
jgi:ribA/ribD-fused uncharacterized protein